MPPSAITITMIRPSKGCDLRSTTTTGFCCLGSVGLFTTESTSRGRPSAISARTGELRHSIRRDRFRDRRTRRQIPGSKRSPSIGSNWRCFAWTLLWCELSPPERNGRASMPIPPFKLRKSHHFRGLLPIWAEFQRSRPPRIHRHLINPRANSHDSARSRALRNLSFIESKPPNSTLCGTLVGCSSLDASAICTAH